MNDADRTIWADALRSSGSRGRNARLQFIDSISRPVTPATNALSALAQVGQRLVGAYMMKDFADEEDRRATTASRTLDAAMNAFTGRPAETQTYGDGTEIRWNAQDPDRRLGMALLSTNPDTAPLAGRMLESERKATLDRDTKAFEHGYRPTADGGYAPIPGGWADPAYAGSMAYAKTAGEESARYPFQTGRDAYQSDLRMYEENAKPRVVPPGGELVAGRAARPEPAFLPSGAANGMGPKTPGAQARPPGNSYAQTVAQVESGGNPNARPLDPTTGRPRSSAYGPAQFLDGTWLEVLSKHAPGVVATVAGPNADPNDPEVKARLLELRADPDLAAAMTEAYAKDNAALFARAGIEATPENLHLAHTLGGVGAARFLTAPPNTPAPQVAGTAAVRANPELFLDAASGQPRTVGQVRQLLAGRFAGASQPAQPQAAPAASAPGGAGPAPIYRNTQPAPGSQEGAFAKGRGEMQAKALEAWKGAADQAAAQRRLVAQARGALDRGLQTGVLADAQTSAARVMTSLGVPDRVVNSFFNAADAKTFENASNQMVLSIVKGLGPNPSNADRDFIERTVPLLRDTPAQARAVLDLIDQRSADDVDRWNLGYQHTRNGGDPLEFDLMWREREAKELNGRRYIKVGGQWYEAGQ